MRKGWVPSTSRKALASAWQLSLLFPLPTGTAVAPVAGALVAPAGAPVAAIAVGAAGGATLPAPQADRSTRHMAAKTANVAPLIRFFICVFSLFSFGCRLSVEPQRDEIVQVAKRTKV